MSALTPDPITVARLNESVANIEAGRIRDRYNQTLTEAAEAKAAREQQAFNEQTDAAGRRVNMATDLLVRPHPSEPPVPVDIVQTPAQVAAADTVAANAPPLSTIMPGQSPGSANPDENLALQSWLARQPGAEPPVPVDLSTQPAAVAAKDPWNVVGTGSALPFPAPQVDPSKDVAITSAFKNPNLPAEPPEVVDLDARRPLSIVSPQDKAAAAAAASKAPGGAVDDGRGNIITPDGRTLSKADIKAQLLVAMRGNDPEGQTRSLLGQLGLIYSDNPEDLKKAAVLLSEDPTKLGPQGNADQAKAEAELREKITKLPAYADLANSESVFASMVESAKSDTKAANMDLVYAIATLEDPGSVVRSSDALMVQRTGGFSGEVAAALSYFNDKGELTPDMKRNLLQVAGNRYGAYKQAFDQQMKQYRGIAERQGFDLRNVIPEFRDIKPDEPAKTDEPAELTPAQQNGDEPVPTGTDADGHPQFDFSKMKLWQRDKWLAAHPEYNTGGQ